MHRKRKNERKHKTDRLKINNNAITGKQTAKSRESTERKQS